MATQSGNNNLSYTDLSFTDIKAKIEALLRGDERFAGVVDSAVFKVILDNFVAMTDLTNYYIERTAEESFLETARHLSSVIIGAKQIGYIPKRPTGAVANISVTLANPNPSGTFLPGDVFNIKAGSDSVSFQGTNFVFTRNYAYTLTEADCTMLNGGGEITIERAIPAEDYAAATQGDPTAYEVPIQIMEGERKTVTLYPGLLAGKKYQNYKVDDPTFSNYYGSDDTYDSKAVVSDGSLKCVGNDAMMTRVFIVNNGTKMEYHVNRRSLTVEDWYFNAVELCKDNEIVIGEIPTCLIETNRDTTVSVVFGDGEATRRGANAGETIEVQYLSVKGASANRAGVIGNTLEIDFSQNYTPTGGVGRDFPGEVTCTFLSNIYGGADFESVDSIRANAPAIYSSLDRLVTKSDYMAVLNTITNPIDVRYATAWGESEECVRQGLPAIPGLMNCALVCALGNPYEKDESGNWKVNSPVVPINGSTEEQAQAEANAERLFVEGNGWEDFYAIAYFDLFMKQSAVDYNNYVYNGDDAAMDRVKIFLDYLKKRSQITVTNIYVPPTLHFFKLTGKVVAERYADITALKTKISNLVYEWLSANTGFNKPIHLSSLSSLVCSISEVKNCSLRFVPVNSQGRTPTQPSAALSTFVFVDSDTSISEEDKQSIRRQIQYIWTMYVKKYGLFHQTSYVTPYWTINSDNAKINERSVIKTFSASGYNPYYDTGTYPEPYQEVKALWDGFSQYQFQQEFLKAVYDSEAIYNISPAYRDSENFTHFYKEMMNEMSILFGYSMLDADGNITGFSVDNEYALVYFDGNSVVQEGV